MDQEWSPVQFERMVWKVGLREVVEQHHIQHSSIANYCLEQTRPEQPYCLQETLHLIPEQELES